jgi:hypothetical protein
MVAWLPKNTVLQLFLSRLVNVSGGPKMDSNSLPTPCAQGGFRPHAKVAYFQQLLFQLDAGSLLNAIELG